MKTIRVHAKIAGLVVFAMSRTSFIGVAAADTRDRARAQAVRRAVETISPSLVTIETLGGAQPVQDMGPMGVLEESFKVAEGPTTGVVLSTDGVILASSFNFAREPAVITVILADGRRMVAKLLGRDLIRRLALVKVEATDLKPAAWLQRGDLHVGQYAIACGRGLGGDTPHVSLGIVSALARRNGNAVQTDAKLSPVNYGGPLVDLEGRIIGLIVPMAGAGGALAGAEWYDSGIGFAVYRDKIDLVLEKLTAGQTIEPGKIGVLLGETESEDIVTPLPWLDKVLRRAGAQIVKVAPKSPAAQAELQAGDRITALDGQTCGDLLDLQRRLSDRAAGEEVTLTIKRRWRAFDVKIRLARIADIHGLEPERPRRRGRTTTQPGEEEPTTRPSAD